ncbi:diadenylate cyclase CdaA [Wenyingzhuangia sp. IMCC45533]
MFEFLEFSFIDVLDILLVAFLLYNVYKLLKGTVAINIFIGIAIVFLIYKVTEALNMEMFSSLLGNLISGGAIALIIIFHPEMRKFLLMLGSANLKTKRNFIKQLKFLKAEISIDLDVETIIQVCEKFKDSRTGALIVIERNSNLEFLRERGDTMNIEVNAPILESIFYKNSPLHDGAIIIKGNYIVATRVVLPLSDKSLPSRFGLRHRAAVGVSEKTDAICIAVSEETGEISFVVDGAFELYSSSNELIEKVRMYLS